MNYTIAILYSELLKLHKDGFTIEHEEFSKRILQIEKLGGVFNPMVLEGNALAVYTKETHTIFYFCRNGRYYWFDACSEQTGPVEVITKYSTMSVYDTYDLIQEHALVNEFYIDVQGSILFWLSNPLIDELQTSEMYLFQRYILRYVDAEPLGYVSVIGGASSAEPFVMEHPVLDSVKSIAGYVQYIEGEHARFWESYPDSLLDTLPEFESYYA
jgi:hypothetical protein